MQIILSSIHWLFQRIELKLMLFELADDEDDEDDDEDDEDDDDMFCSSRCVFLCNFR